MNNTDANMSNHILPTSANLMGVCFLIFSLVKTLGQSDQTVLDNLAIAGIFVFLTSSILSYLSLRLAQRNKLLERCADTVFVLGLILLAMTTLVVAFEVAPHLKS